MQAAQPWQQMLMSMSGGEAFAAMKQQGDAQMEQLNVAIARYSAEPYKRTHESAKTVWKMGGARLLAYGLGDAAHAIMIFPSLINRHYIHDLSEDRSMVRHLAEAGYAVYVMDWGEPTDAEKTFDLAEYATNYGVAALQHVRQSHTKILLAGHCLGGMLAMAAASNSPELVDALALLATPWDFCTENAMVPDTMRPHDAMLRTYIKSQPFFAGEQVLAFFYFKDPIGYQNKLLEFAAVQASGKPVDTFLALEQWVNDCVNLTAPVAENCFCDFGLHNKAMRGEWMVGNQPVTPEKLTLPVLLAVPERDKIVPPSSSKPLAESLPNVQILQVDAGHVGMIAGSRAQKLMWQPLAAWADEICE